MPVRVLPTRGVMASFAVDSYHRFQYVDVQDIFWGNKTGRLLTQWQQCQIREVTPTRVRVRYLKWPRYWDEWIDLRVDADRIKCV